MLQALGEKLGLASQNEGDWHQLCNTESVVKTVLSELQQCGTKGKRATMREDWEER